MADISPSPSAEIKEAVIVRRPGKISNPKYNPDLWVLFKLDKGQAFGKIKGGYFSEDDGWLYYVENSSDMDSKVFTVAEVDIIATSDGSEWAKV